eukprot:9005207-Pyramimonas_sp.AAC.1
MATNKAGLSSRLETMWARYGTVCLRRDGHLATGPQLQQHIAALTNDYKCMPDKRMGIYKAKCEN